MVPLKFDTRPMRKLFKYIYLPALVLSVLPTRSLAAAATTVFSDDFNKPDQALLGTTANVGGTWTITGTSVVNPIQISGNQVALTTTGQDAFSAFSSSVPNTAGNVLHTSMDINLSAAQATGDYFSHLSDPAGTTSFFFQRLGAVATTGGYLLQLAVTGGGGATTTAGTTVLSLNQTYHIDEYWTFVAGTLNDTFEIDVNGTSYLTKTWDSTSAEPTSVSAANFRQGTASVAPTLTVDNLQVEVITAPEPSTAFLAGLLGLVGLARRRSRA
jgi:hypothetical protein